jgi:16S rRNA (uracil1498-N3)-methyltransferase
LAGKQLSFVAYENESKNILDLSVMAKKANNINIFVGPEGGFTEMELEEMRKAGFISFGLGGTVLRSETACIVSTGILSQIMLK